MHVVVSIILTMLLPQVPESIWRDNSDNGAWPKPPPHRGKDSVAKMTWDGLSFILAVKIH